MNNRITDLLNSLLSQYRSSDLAEREFKKLLYEDNEIKNEYNEWCDALGYSYRSGYSEYLEEQKEQEESLWDSINEYEDYN
ncbi:MAG: hypothetical protein R3Y22_08345 [Bacteroidales bacterium]